MQEKINDNCIQCKSIYSIKNDKNEKVIFYSNSGKKDPNALGSNLFEIKQNKRDDISSSLNCKYLPYYHSETHLLESPKLKKVLG